MSKNLLFPFTKLPIEQLDSIISLKDPITFLAGAGISVDPPSNLPTSRQIIHALLNHYAPREEIDHLLQISPLKFEFIIECIQNKIDSNLEFLDYLEFPIPSNEIHQMVVQASIHGHWVATTNFDYQLERSMLNLSPSRKIIPIISKIDYERYFNPNARQKDEIWLYKLHGSNQNLVTKEKTKDSLITTLSALGKNRDKGEIFALETFKRPAVSNLIEQRVLLVLGYSGQDIFDLAPFLRDSANPEKLIWIWHSDNDPINLYQIDSNPKDSITDPTILLLKDLAKSKRFKVFILQGPTKEILKTVLQAIHINDKSPNIPSADSIPLFSGWLKTLKIPRFFESYSLAFEIYY